MSLYYSTAYHNLDKMVASAEDGTGILKAKPRPIINLLKQLELYRLDLCQLDVSQSDLSQLELTIARVKR